MGMVIWWDTSKTPGGGGGEGSSQGPGDPNVKKGVKYTINGVARVGTYDLFVVNTNFDTDIVSMAVTALQDWLTGQIDGLTVRDEWPYGNQKLAYPLVTLFSGRAKRMPLMPEIVAQTDPDENNQIVATEVVAEYDFTIQLDLWCRNKLERKQELAKLLTAFNFQEVDDSGENKPDGLTLILANYFNMPVRYEVDYHQHKDDEQAAERQERRETMSLLVNLREIRTRTYYAMTTTEVHSGVGPSDSDTDALDTTTT